MALQLSPKTQARISEMVTSGDYADADAMLGQALALLEERERLMHLRALLAVGAEQAARGELVPYDEEFREASKRRARERFEAGEVAGPDVRP